VNFLLIYQDTMFTLPLNIFIVPCYEPRCEREFFLGNTDCFCSKRLRSSIIFVKINLLSCLDIPSCLFYLTVGFIAVRPISVLKYCCYGQKITSRRHFNEDRAVAQVVSRLPFTAEALHVYCLLWMNIGQLAAAVQRYSLPPSA
jgi:hypothetical protein